MGRLHWSSIAKGAAAELDGFCEHWIGWSRPPVSQVVDDANWRRSARTDCCHRCGQSVGPGESGKSGCGACRGRSVPNDGVVRLGTYSDPLRPWVLGVKYSNWPEMGRRLGSELGRAVREAQVVEQRSAVVVPMPMPWLRRVYRGIDHAAVIGSSVAQELDVPLAHVLKKANGPTQLSVPKAARRVNARHGMGIRWRWGGWPLKGLHAILVDDVRTTGSSMAAAGRLLRSLGASKVVEAVICVAESGRRSETRQSDEEAAPST